MKVPSTQHKEQEPPHSPRSLNHCTSGPCSPCLLGGFASYENRPYNEQCQVTKNSSGKMTPSNERPWGVRRCSQNPSTSDPMLRNDEVSGCEHATRFFDDRSREISSGCRALTFFENQFFVVATTSQHPPRDVP